MNIAMAATTSWRAALGQLQTGRQGAGSRGHAVPERTLREEAYLTVWSGTASHPLGTRKPLPRTSAALRGGQEQPSGYVAASSACWRSSCRRAV